jgi:hypothetical protein
MNRTCVRCGSRFAGYHNAKFCGPECRLERRLAGNKIWGATYRAKNRKPRPEPEPIPAFPADIDRQSFGHWLSGFADGESTFILREGYQKDRRQPRIIRFAYFRVTLRDDDTESLRLIRSYWACGMMYFSDSIRSKTKTNPSASYAVQAVSDLMKVVIPHFDRFPLRSKKMNDFIIWKQGVELMAEIQSRPLVGRLVQGGLMPRWTDEERDKFHSLSESLSHQRIYTSLRSS